MEPRVGGGRDTEADAEEMRHVELNDSLRLSGGGTTGGGLVHLDGRVGIDSAVLHTPYQTEEVEFSTPGSSTRVSALQRPQRDVVVASNGRASAPGSSHIYRHVVGVINPGSGEKAAATLVRRAMLAELGVGRVVVLDDATFADPTPLRQMIKEQAVMYPTPDNGRGVAGPQPEGVRGTIVVSGGDGTIGFVMQQLDLVRAELVEEFDVGSSTSPLPATPSTGDVRNKGSGNREVTGTTTKLDSGGHRHWDDSDGTLKREAAESTGPFVMPAVAPLPLGTGNDYSNCTGFGRGFKSTSTCGDCVSGSATEVSILLREAVQAPCTRFDRWDVSFVPLRVAQAHLTAIPAAADAEGGRRGEAAQRPREPRFGNVIHHVDWGAIYSTNTCTTHPLINYLGVGFDAYVVRKFDETRRRHPTLCSTRMQNKAVYGVMGLQSAVKCMKMRKMVPLVCIPNSWPARGGPGGGTGAETTTVVSRGKPQMIPLQLPSSAKALVITNVSSYSAGGRSWDNASRDVYYRPMELTNDNSLAPAAKGDSWAPVITAVAINDGKFELQAMGGLMHYGALTLGIAGATKMAQSNEMFAFVLCTPQDLVCSAGSTTALTEARFLPLTRRIATDSDVRASLSVQIDGEALPHISEPTIIHLRPVRSERIYVRCQNPEVVRKSSSDSQVHVVVD